MQGKVCATDWTEHEGPIFGTKIFAQWSINTQGSAGALGCYSIISARFTNTVTGALIQTETTYINTCLFTLEVLTGPTWVTWQIFMNSIAVASEVHSVSSYILLSLSDTNHSAIPHPRVLFCKHLSLFFFRLNWPQDAKFAANFCNELAVLRKKGHWKFLTGWDYKGHMMMCTCG